MPARRMIRTYHSPEAAHSKVMAAQEELDGRAEPMRRWPHPIPMAVSAVPVRSGETAATPTMTQTLEKLQYQNQILTDLLGAVNALTAAVLCQRGNGDE